MKLSRLSRLEHRFGAEDRRSKGKRPKKAESEGRERCGGRKGRSERERKSIETKSPLETGFKIIFFS